MIYALGVLAFVVGLALSVGLHEVGHFLPAKKFGVKISQFFVGFGPTLWSTRRGETEYGVKAIPLGGFVRLIGMLPPEKDRDPHDLRKFDTGLFTQMAADARAADHEHVADTDADRLFYRKPVWQKVIVMAGGPTVNVILATMCFSVVLMGFGIEKPTTTIQAVSDCAISDAEAGRACTDADPVAPARRAGLRAGDVITAFNGHRVSGWTDLSKRIRDNGAHTATVRFVRDGTSHVVQVRTAVIVRAALNDPSKQEGVGFLGVAPALVAQRQGPLYVATFMGTAVKATGMAIVHLPARMVDVVKAAMGDKRDSNGPISVVGASRVAGELVTLDKPTSGQRIVRIVGLIGSLNLFLALFNLIPLLPLDGGHVAGALCEGARRQLARWRGRPDPGYVDVAKMLPMAYGVGLILIVMSVILIYADIVNPVKLS